MSPRTYTRTRQCEAELTYELQFDLSCVQDPVTLAWLSLEALTLRCDAVEKQYHRELAALNQQYDKARAAYKNEIDKRSGANVDGAT